LLRLASPPLVHLLAHSVDEILGFSIVERHAGFRLLVGHLAQLGEARPARVLLALLGGSGSTRDRERESE